MALFSKLPPGEQIKRWLSILTTLIIVLDIIAAGSLLVVTNLMNSIVARHEPVAFYSGDIASSIFKVQTGLYQYLGEYRQDTVELQAEIRAIQTSIGDASKLEGAADFGPALKETGAALERYETAVKLLPKIGAAQTRWAEVEELKNQAMEQGKVVEELAAKMKADAYRTIAQKAARSRQVATAAMYTFIGFFLLSVVIIVLLFIWWRSFQEMMLSL